MMQNSFENNLKVEDAFNILLNSNIWVKHSGRQAQAKIGDFYNTILGKNIDFKIDCYDNKNNIVIEENQISGTNWIDELDDNSFIAYVKVNNGACFCWSVKQLKDFRNTSVYKSRKSFKAWSETTFKNFRLSEMPEYFMFKFDTSSLSKYLKEDKYGDEKYNNIERVIRRIKEC